MAECNSSTSGGTVFTVSYAPTDRAKCAKCKNPIALGSLRASRCIQNEWTGDKGASYRHYHFDCALKAAEGVRCPKPGNAKEDEGVSWWRRLSATTTGTSDILSKSAPTLAPIPPGALKDRDAKKAEKAFGDVRKRWLAKCASKPVAPKGGGDRTKGKTKGKAERDARARSGAAISTPPQRPRIGPPKSRPSSGSGSGSGNPLFARAVSTLKGSSVTGRLTTGGPTMTRHSEPNHAGFVPYAGNLPYFSLRTSEGAHFYIDSNRERRFRVYTNFEWNASVDTEEFPPHPAWTFLVTNGREEVFVSVNAGECYVESKPVSIRISERTAVDLARSLGEDLAMFSKEEGVSVRGSKASAFLPKGTAKGMESDALMTEIRFG